MKRCLGVHAEAELTVLDGIESDRQSSESTFLHFLDIPTDQRVSLDSGDPAIPDKIKNDAIHMPLHNPKIENMELSHNTRRHGG